MSELGDLDTAIDWGTLMSSREAIETDIRAIVSRALDGAIAPEDLPTDVPVFSGGLGMDSMSGIELLTAIEERFGIYIDDDNFQIFDSLDQMISFVESSLEDSSE